MKLFIFLAAAAVLLLVDNCDAWFSRRGSLGDSRSRSLSNNRCPKPRFEGCDTTNSCSGGQCLQIPECTTTSTYCACGSDNQCPAGQSCVTLNTELTRDFLPSGTIIRFCSTNTNITGCQYNSRYNLCQCGRGSWRRFNPGFRSVTTTTTTAGPLPVVNDPLALTDNMDGQDKGGIVVESQGQGGRSEGGQHRGSGWGGSFGGGK